MDKINSLSDFFNQQTDVAIWYAAYENREESICYANPYFAEIFELPLDQILARKRYHLVNPPDTSSETIETYRQEDRQAIDKGFFLNRSAIDDHQDIVIAKLRFERGVLGLFKFVTPREKPCELSWQNLDQKILTILKECDLPENLSLQ